jgi:hypothetical protein
MSIVGALQSVDDGFGLRDDFNKVVPDDAVQLVCWDVS